MTRRSASSRCLGRRVGAWCVAALAMAALGQGLAPAMAAASAPADAVQAGAVVDADHAQRLQRLLVQDCGSCHGLRMKGGLGPALTPDVLRDKPDDMLVATVLLGRPGTAMPPWQPLLTSTEAAWMIARLKQGIQP